jgi:hypothetical protein
MKKYKPKKEIRLASDKLDLYSLPNINITKPDPLFENSSFVDKTKREFWELENKFPLYAPVPITSTPTKSVFPNLEYFVLEPFKPIELIPISSSPRRSLSPIPGFPQMRNFSPSPDTHSTSYEMVNEVLGSDFIKNLDTNSLSYSFLKLLNDVFTEQETPIKSNELKAYTQLLSDPCLGALLKGNNVKLNQQDYQISINKRYSIFKNFLLYYDRIAIRLYKTDLELKSFLCKDLENHPGKEKILVDLVQSSLFFRKWRKEADPLLVDKAISLSRAAMPKGLKMRSLS